MKMNIQGLVLNTFRESARNKMFYLLVFFGILFALSSKLVSFLTLGDTMKVLKDTGLAAINFFCVLIAVFTGINLVYKEIEKKTVFNILSKPVSRDDFIVGKFLGLALTMLTALGSMAVIFFFFVALSGGGFDLKIALFFF
ncbi:MAG TPA: ABC transporter permease subunit, partial [Candidatus Binatia bacterium]|nr:ABC transporter permease subunit [Candidatus Binatia bacterium]